MAVYQTPLIMRKAYCLACVLLYLLPGLRAQELVRESVYFDTDKHQLRAQSYQVLDDLIQQTTALGDFHLQILAFTDDRGSTDYNLSLAERRADAVKAYLLENGLIAEKTSVQSLGEVQITQAEPEEKQRAQHRRVDLIVTVKTIESLAALMAELNEDRTQTFTLQGDEGGRLKGKAGTNVWVEPHTFRFADGSHPQTPITLSLKEAYGYEEMILDGLSTHSDGNLLETGGMIYLEASADGQALQIGPGSDIVVGMPTQKQLPGMQLFMGEQNTAGQVANWTPTQQAFRTGFNEMLAALPPKPKLAHEWIKPPKPAIDYSNEPVRPRKPFKPNEPNKPAAEATYYKAGILRKLVIGKSRLAKKEAKLLAQKMKDYDRKMERYQKRKATYDMAMLKYNEEVSTFDQRHKEWQEGLEKQKIDFRDSPEFKNYLARKEKSQLARFKQYEKELAAWEASKAQRLLDYEEKYGDQIVASASLSLQYFYRVNKLGWINCDRFYNIPPEEKMNLAVADDDEEKEEIFVLFKDIKSMMKAKQQAGSKAYLTQAVPKDAAIRIVGIKVKNGKAHLAIKDTTAGASSLHQLTYQATSLKMIREALQNLDV